MLTQTQRDLLLFIEREIDEKGRPPCNREIGDHFGYSTKGNGSNNVHRMIHCLVERGYIELRRYHARSIVVLRPVSRFAVFKFDDRTKELDHGRHFNPSRAGREQGLRSKCTREG